MGCGHEATTRPLPYGDVSPSGGWVFAKAVQETSIGIDAVEGRLKFALPLPRFSDLKFVGWGPDQVQGDDVVWIYSADVGSLLYSVDADGPARLACPPAGLAPPDGWPGPRHLRCTAS